MAFVYIGLGANLGDRRANLALGLRLLPPLVRVEAVSPLYESEPQPPAPGPDYLNAACRAVTQLSPEELLAYLKRIETQAGRRPSERWAPRTLDLDILLYDGLVMDTPDLVVPHSRLLERAFVLQPLLDLDASLVHPVTGERLADALSRVGRAGLRSFAASGWEEG